MGHREVTANIAGHTAYVHTPVQNTRQDLNDILRPRPPRTSKVGVLGPAEIVGRKVAK